MTVLVLSLASGDAPATATAGGGVSISCTNTDSILGPLQSSVTLAPGSGGFLQLGAPNGGKGHYVGNCTLDGTIPAGWTVAEGSWVALSATTGSANAGTVVLSTPNSTFSDAGTFTNSGKFEDDSNGAHPDHSRQGVRQHWHRGVQGRRLRDLRYHGRPPVPGVRVRGPGHPPGRAQAGLHLREHFRARAGWDD